MIIASLSAQWAFLFKAVIAALYIRIECLSSQSILFSLSFGNFIIREKNSI